MIRNNDLRTKFHLDNRLMGLKLEGLFTHVLVFHVNAIIGVIKRYQSGHMRRLRLLVYVPDVQRGPHLVRGNTAIGAFSS